MVGGYLQGGGRLLTGWWEVTYRVVGDYLQGGTRPLTGW